MTELEQHLSYLREALAAAEAAPLSRRRVMLVVMLVDAYADRLFEASDEGDLLVFRERLAAGSAALGLVFEIAAQREGGARLVVEAVEVPIADYARLSEPDFMVSLYNGASVQRVRVALADGGRVLALTVLREAAGALER
jgi:hypothetical protein